MNPKLIFIIAKLAKKHGLKVLHADNVNALTTDLGIALRIQKKHIQDPDLGIVETAYEVLPVMAEVKLLTMIVSKKLGIDTKDKSTIEVLEEIITKTEERDSLAAANIKKTLDWTRGFFSHPEVQQILKADLVEIQAPKGLTDFKGLAMGAFQTTRRVQQEYSRLLEFLEKAKKLNDNALPKTGKVEPEIKAIPKTTLAKNIKKKKPKKGPKGPEK